MYIIVNKIYKSQKTIQQLRDGILGHYVDDFSTYIIEQGYSQKTFRLRFGLISKLNSWVQAHKIVLNTSS